MKVFKLFKRLCILPITLTLAALNAAEDNSIVTVVDFFVSPDGSDKSPGTLEQPFATIQGARDAIRKLPAKERDRDLRVLLRGGTYTLTKTVVFSLKDSASEGRTITYAAYPGEKPVFSSGVPFDDWSLLEGAPEGFNHAAEGKIWVTTVPRRLGDFYTLYKGETRLPRARTKGFRQLTGTKTYRDGRRDFVRFPEGLIKKGPNVDEWEVVVITAAPWNMAILPVKFLNEQSSALVTSEAAWYSVAPPRFGEFAESAWVENSLAGLDEPGEWVLDRSGNRLYYWSQDGDPGDSILAPTLTELIRVEGEIDYLGTADKPVRGLVFEGLTFTHADRYKWRVDREGLTLQHEWEMFDQPSAMIRFRGAEGCAIRHCRFSNAGSTAIRLDLHAQDNRLEGNRIEHIGGVGILLAGYGPGTKDVNRRNFIVHNHIDQIGEVYWHSPGIFVWQSGENTVRNNLIHNTPYTGIVVSGRIAWNRQGTGECSRTIRWNEVDEVLGKGRRGRPSWEVREQFLHARNNLVLRNEIHHVMEVLSDGNGIYISGAGSGNLIQENFIRDCPSELFSQAIRCDDDQNGTVIDRNIIWNIGGKSEFALIKGRNDITGNIFANPLNKPWRGMLALIPERPGGTDGSIVERNIFYSARDDANICYQERNYYGNQGRLAKCDADNNVYFNPHNSAWGRSHLEAEQKLRSEPNSISSDPQFVDLENGDFRFKDSSPVMDLGITPVDLGLIGLSGPTGPLSIPRNE